MGIKIEGTNKELSSLSGLLIFKELFDSLLPCLDLQHDRLPTLKSGTKRSIDKLCQLTLGFLAGAECFDEFKRLSNDLAFTSLCGGKVYDPKTFGDFLRSFSPLQCKYLNLSLMQAGFELRRVLQPDLKSITFDIDSTSNEQFGLKMEGVEKDYKGLNCLSSIQAFDELGFQYWHDVRPGRTHSSKGSPEIIHRIFYNIPEYLSKFEKNVRADSAYCNRGFFFACSAKNARFVVCMRKLMLKPLIKTIVSWEKQDTDDEKRILFYDGRECEIGETTYRPKDSPYLYRVIVIRSVKKECENQLILSPEDYDYHGWVCSIPQEMNGAEVVKFYRKRGHCENFIRELKNGMDLKHYPSQSLSANKAYGIMAGLAHNLLRFIALKDNPKRPQFAKAIRNKFIYIPCMVIRHARDTIFRFMDLHLKGVRKWLLEIGRLNLGIPAHPT